MRTVAEMQALADMLPYKSQEYIWVNYHDIQLNASIAGSNRPPFLSSTYMGSHSTLEKVPDEFWHPWHEAGSNRQKGDNCLLIGKRSDTGIVDWPCDGKGLSGPVRSTRVDLICMIDVATLSEHIEMLNE